MPAAPGIAPHPARPSSQESHRCGVRGARRSPPRGCRQVPGPRRVASRSPLPPAFSVMSLRSPWAGDTLKLTLKISDYGNELREVDLGSGLAGANAEIREARRMEVIRLLNERSYQAAIAATDYVIAHLEELNLEGRGKERLGSNAASQLEQILGPVPKELRPEIRGRTVQRTLEALLDVQKPLLERRRQARTAQVVAARRGWRRGGVSGGMNQSCSPTRGGGTRGARSRRRGRPTEASVPPPRGVSGSSSSLPARRLRP